MEKTEKATPHKRSEQRKEGNVMRSREVSTAASALIMFVLMFITFPSYADKLIGVYRSLLSSGLTAGIQREPSITSYGGLFTSLVLRFFSILAPIMITAMLVGLLSNILQVGFMFNTKPLKPKFSKLNFIKGFKRLFSLNSLVELAKSVIKVIVLGFIAYSDYTEYLKFFPHYIGRNLGVLFIETMRRTFMTAIKMSAALAALASLDYLYQWWKFEKDMKMTKQEVKDERKQMEGSPEVKSEVRRRMRRVSAMRMMERVPSADVVITNPTHYAIVLRYEDGVDEAPVVIAKGVDYLARRIKELATQYGVPIVENPPLARSLYDACEVDDLIPPELFQAVADFQGILRDFT